MLKQFLTDIFSDHFALTKRHLGILLLLGGVLVLAAAGAAEIVRDQPGGFGTMQKLAVLVGVMGALTGATLLPLGDRPA